MDQNDNQPDGSADTQHSDRPTAEMDVTPTVSCSTCGQEWNLTYELDELHVGNRAVEQFALDHYRHTGHYPDDVTPWIASCRQCPSEEQYLEQRPAKRFGETHARHTQHTVVIRGPDEEDETCIEPHSVTGTSSSESGTTE